MVASTDLLGAAPGPEPILSLVDLLHEIFRTTLVRVQPALAEEGITIGQFWALHTLSEVESPTLGTVARHLGISAPTACTNFDLLEMSDLVRRTRSAKDRRTVELSLTPRGRRVESRIWREIARLMTSAAGRIPESELRGAVRVLRDVTEGLQPGATGRGRAL